MGLLAMVEELERGEIDNLECAEPHGETFAFAFVFDIDACFFGRGLAATIAVSAVVDDPRRVVTMMTCTQQDWTRSKWNRT